MEGEIRPAGATHEAYRAVRVFGGLDGLRCLSILAVVWHHAGGSEGAMGRLFPAAGFGFLGVDLFFEISGFLIVTLLLRERERRGDISLRNFYARRALRIFPLYYGILLLFTILYLGVRPHSPLSAPFRHDLPWLLSYMTNWVTASGMLAITWSLSAEEQFYVVWPAVETWLAKAATALVLVLIAVSQIIHFGLIDPQLRQWFGWAPDQPQMLRQTTFTPILLGVLLAHLLHSPRGYARAAAVFGSRAAAPVCLAALVVLANVLPADIRGWGRLSVHLLMFCLLAACVVREDNGLRRFLAWGPVARIGTLSYGIYLLHHIGLAIAGKGLRVVHLEHPVALFVVGGALSVGLAALSYRFYETPFLRLKSRVAS
ncbi:MAG TPA: acyltransferase [Planctomycetota bacterium]|nr:acyltransferase [Planctomycetota bacterium]